MFRAGIARSVLAVVSRCDVFGSIQLRLGKSRQGGLGPVRSGTASRGEVSQGGLGTVCYG